MLIHEHHHPLQDPECSPLLADVLELGVPAGMGRSGEPLAVLCREPPTPVVLLQNAEQRGELV